MKEQNFYKCQSNHIIRMFPSDPTGSLDDFFLKGGLLNWKKH